MYNYSYLKTFFNGAKHFLAGIAGFALVVAVLSGYDKVSIWDLIVKYIQPVAGSLTVGAVILMFQNWLKNS